MWQIINARSDLSQEEACEKCMIDLFPLLFFIYFYTSENSSSADPHSHVTACSLIWQLLPTPFPLAFLIQTCTSISASLPPSALSCTQDLSCTPPSLTRTGMQLSFYEIPVLGFWEHDWLPCGEDRGTILCPATSLNPFWNIHSETPGAFYSTSNIRPKGKTRCWCIH